MKKHMETKIKSCEVLRNKRKSLRVDYLQEPDVFKRTEILRKRKKTTEKMLKVQSEISKLLLDELKQND
jgi:aspartyl/asparaginyl-tRNA synthetase